MLLNCFSPVQLFETLWTAACQSTDCIPWETEEHIHFKNYVHGLGHQVAALGYLPTPPGQASQTTGQHRNHAGVLFRSCWDSGFRTCTGFSNRPQVMPALWLPTAGPGEVRKSPGTCDHTQDLV